MDRYPLQRAQRCPPFRTDRLRLERADLAEESGNHASKPASFGQTRPDKVFVPLQQTNQVQFEQPLRSFEQLCLSKMARIELHPSRQWSRPPCRLATPQKSGATLQRSARHSRQPASPSHQGALRYRGKGRSHRDQLQVGPPEGMTGIDPVEASPNAAALLGRVEGREAHWQRDTRPSR